MRVKQITIALGLLLIAGFLFWQTRSLPSDGGYSGISARTFPLMIEAGLAGCGLFLLLAVLRGSWRDDDAAAKPRSISPLLWVLGGLIFQLATISTLGFVPTSAVMFACVARGFRETPSWAAFARDVLIGAVLALTIWLIFTQALGLNLRGFFE